MYSRALRSSNLRIFRLEGVPCTPFWHLNLFRSLIQYIALKQTVDRLTDLLYRQEQRISFSLLSRSFSCCSKAITSAILISGTPFFPLLLRNYQYKTFPNFCKAKSAARFDSFRLFSRRIYCLLFDNAQESVPRPKIRHNTYDRHSPSHVEKFLPNRNKYVSFWHWKISRENATI